MTRLFPPRITGSVQGPFLQQGFAKRLASVALFYGILGALGAFLVVICSGALSLLRSGPNGSPLAEPMTYLLIAWGLVTAVFLVLLIWRSYLSNHDDDQIFLDAAEEHMAQEQRELVSRINSLSRPLATSGAVSAVLFLVLAGIWIYKGLAANL